MTLSIGIVLSVLTFAFIVYPFFKQRVRPAGVVEDEKLQELHSKRDTTYSMLKELEFDFQSGILTGEDYRDLETRYKRKAISILKETDAQEKGADLEDEIEKQVRELRRGKARPQVTREARRETTVEAEVEEEVIKLRQQKSRFCPQCGARHEEGDRFCSECGTRLIREEKG